MEHAFFTMLFSIGSLLLIGYIFFALFGKGKAYQKAVGSGLGWMAFLPFRLIGGLAKNIYYMFNPAAAERARRRNRQNRRRRREDEDDD